MPTEIDTLPSACPQLKLAARVEEVDAFVREARGWLHCHPEICGEERQTSAYIKQHINELGLGFEEIPGKGGTGCIATLDTGRPGKTVCLRADIDALPIEESPKNLMGPKTWVSDNRGVSHACGHDGHISMLLGAMRVLCSIKDHLRGKILFAFEEGEEAGTGISGMIHALKNRGIDAVFGIHVASFLNAGKVAMDAGPVMAGAASVNFTVHGKEGHGSRPDQAINPIFAAAEILVGIASAWNNQMPVDKTVTLGIAQIHAGTRNNIIPNTCTIGGSIRYFDVDAGAQGLEVIKRVASLTAQAHRCTVEYDKSMTVATMPVCNDPAMAALASKGAEDLFPTALVKHVQWYASDSFFKYGQEIAPAVYAFVGIRNPELGSGAPHHTAEFDLDEDALHYGVGIACAFAINVLLS